MLDTILEELLQRGVLRDIVSFFSILKDYYRLYQTNIDKINSRLLAYRIISENYVNHLLLRSLSHSRYIIDNKKTRYYIEESCVVAAYCDVALSSIKKDTIIYVRCISVLDKSSSYFFFQRSRGQELEPGCFYNEEAKAFLLSVKL